MKKPLSTLVIGLVMFMLFSPLVPDVSALGIGIYRTFSSSGSATIDTEWNSYNYRYNYGDYYSTEEDAEADTSVESLGFVYDNNLARDTLSNTRINIGWTSTEYEAEEYGKSKMDLSGLSMDATFGFGFIRNQRVRIWAGPQLRFFTMSGDFESKEFADRKIDSGFGIGAGGVLGANIHFGSSLSLCLELGTRWNIGFGTITIDYRDLNYNPASEEDDFSVKDNDVFFNISIVYRIDDFFEVK